MINTILEYGMNGKPLKMVGEKDNFKIYTDITYDYKDRIIKKQETTIDKYTNEVIDIFINEREYHDNGEFKCIKNNKGDIVHFDINGLPIL